jgi:subtilisin family serine protease
MAPGENIYSTHLCLGSVECNSYMSRQGTSMAAPHVSGVAGLILSRNPGLGYARVKSVILENVDKLTAVTDKLVSGGRLNAFKALSQTCYPGEVTGGAGIGLSDVIAALRIASGLDAGATVCRMADADGDGRIGLAEAVYDLQVLSLLRDE